MKTFIYCTKAKPYLLRTFEQVSVSSEVEYCELSNKMPLKEKYIHRDILNGKVVASFDLNKIEEIECYYEKDLVLEAEFPFIRSDELGECELEEKACLEWWKIWDYLKGKNGFVYHIENLEIIEPLELSEFVSAKKWENYMKLPLIKIDQNDDCFKITKATQDFMYAYYKGEKVLLISIRPKWVEKILNGKQTVLVRKRAPREIIRRKGERE